jgi:hypothetical protein
VVVIVTALLFHTASGLVLICNDVVFLKPAAISVHRFLGGWERHSPQAWLQGVLQLHNAHFCVASVFLLLPLLSRSDESLFAHLLMQVLLSACVLGLCVNVMFCLSCASAAGVLCRSSRT